MISVLIYNQSFRHNANLLNVGTKLHHLFGARLHFLQKAGESANRHKNLSSDDKFSYIAATGLEIYEHKVTKITNDIASSYMKAINTDLLFLELDENGFKEKDVQTLVKVVRDSNLPMLLLKNNFPKMKLENVLLIVDAAYFGRGLQLNLLKQFFDSQHAKIHLLHILQKKETEDVAHEQLIFFAKTHGISPASMHVSMADKAEEATLKIFEKFSIDLFCIRTNGNKEKKEGSFRDIDIVFLLETKTPIFTFHLKHYD